jgi:processive 1,2-diacylglycerol beta-glucosyltransferase
MEAAKNIQKAVEAEDPDAEVRIIDGLAESPAIWAWAMNYWWVTTQNKAGWLWDWMYNSKLFQTKLWGFFMYWLPWWGLRRALRKYKPDVVFCTHFVCVPVASGVRKGSKEIDFRLNYVVTEFIWHDSYFWWPEADQYFIAADIGRQKLLAQGYPEEKINFTGIPIKEAFATEISKEAAREKLGFPQDKKVLFFFAGTFGGTNVAKVIHEIKEMDIYPVVVCGKNESAKKNIEKLLSKEQLDGTVYGFVDFMNEIMSACDFMIGKGGGLSCAECLALGVPILLYGSPPGHELGNAEHLEALGAGVVTPTIDDVLKNIHDLLDNPDKLATMREKSKAAGHPNSSREVARAAIADRKASLAGASDNKQLSA